MAGEPTALTPTAKLTRANFGGLMTPIHKKIFNDAYAELPKVYPNTFSVDNMSMKDEKFLHIGTVGLFQTNSEGSDFNVDPFGEELEVTFSAVRYDKAYSVTWELMQDDQGSVFKGEGKGGSAKKLARALRATEESVAAKVIKTGFSGVSGATNGFDGVTLFNSAHPTNNVPNYNASTHPEGVDYPGDMSDDNPAHESSVIPNTQSNVVSGALTDTNLKAALTKLRGQLDDRGTPIATHGKKLVVAPDWEFTARAILNSTLQAGTANNDINTVPNLQLIVWDYLADGTIKPWYVQDDTIDNLMFLWREKPIFDSERIQNKMDYRFFGYARFAVGYVDWHGLVGSKGV